VDGPVDASLHQLAPAEGASESSDHGVVDSGAIVGGSGSSRHQDQLSPTPFPDGGGHMES
jgi:hypothetical protein